MEHDVMMLVLLVTFGLCALSFSRSQIRAQREREELVRKYYEEKKIRRAKGQSGPPRPYI